MSERKIYALMLVKSKSSRLPGKNILMFHGKPMFLHNLDKCLGIFDKVYVSSDDDNILDWADSRGAIAIKRPLNLCGDTPNIPVYRHALLHMDNPTDIVAVQANSPTLLPIIIKEVKDKLKYYSEIMTIHPDKKIYGSVWGLSVKKLKEAYKDVFNFYNPQPEYVIVDYSVDIHTMKDYERALKQI